MVQGYAHAGIKRNDSRKVAYGFAMIVEGLQGLTVMGFERRDNIMMRRQPGSCCSFAHRESGFLSVAQRFQLFAMDMLDQNFTVCFVQVFEIKRNPYLVLLPAGIVFNQDHAGNDDEPQSGGQ